MPVLKRPSSAADLQPKKRPAAGGSIKDVVSELKQSHDHDDDANDGDSTNRDKQKAQKFHKMLSQGSLPDHIVHMFNIESKKKQGGCPSLPNQANQFLVFQTVRWNFQAPNWSARVSGVPENFPSESRERQNRVIAPYSHACISFPWRWAAHEESHWQWWVGG